MLALKSGQTKEKSEEFVKEFFSLISESLKEGESVKIRSLGTFKIINVETRKSVNVTNGEEIVIPEHKRIVFVPSKEMAEVVNAPFSMFESVELHPDAEKELEETSENAAPVVTEEEAPGEQEKSTEEVETPEISEGAVEEVEETSEIAETAAEEVEETSETAEAAAEEVEETPEIAETSAQESVESTTTTEAAVEPVESTDEEADQVEATEAVEEIRPVIEDPREKGNGKGGMKFIMGFISGLVVALLLAGVGYWYFIYRELPQAKPQPEEKVATAVPSEPMKDTAIAIADEDTVAMPPQLTEAEVTEANAELPPTKPSDSEAKVIKDVIGPHNYLTTMAQRHYGDFNLWAYIYEENKSFLGHPDRIKPGTEVVVPPLSKYGVDPKNPKDILKAKRLGAEIYNRYK